MKSKKINTDQASDLSQENKDANELNELVKKTSLQDKVLKKMIEEIKKSADEK